MINVEFRSNDGAGFVKHVEVEEGMTAIRLFTKMMDRRDESGEVIGSADAGKYIIRVNHEQVKPTHLMQNGDIMSVAPSKVDGA